MQTTNRKYLDGSQMYSSDKTYFVIVEKKLFSTKYIRLISDVDLEAWLNKLQDLGVYAVQELEVKKTDLERASQFNDITEVNRFCNALNKYAGRLFYTEGGEK